ncbi:RagB/SusD family nutrient uptake outer membrane protein [Sinomicrobium sp.]
MKNYINNKIMTTVGLGILFCFTGCDLDVEPAEELAPGQILTTTEGMEGLAISLHSRLRAAARYGRDLVLLPDVLADNTDRHPISSGRYVGQSVNRHASHMGLWASAWNPINEANIIIDAIDNVEEMSEDVRNRLLGEAYFHRAFAYHDLVKIYGYEPGREVDGWDLGVMIRETPTYDVSDADDRPRSTNREVYDLIESDLVKAIELLAQGDRGVYYANHTAALTLMARVQLYLENWENAIDYATQAISASNVGLASQSVYAANMYEQEPNPESIYELRIDPENESLGSSDALDQYINPSGWFDILPSQSLIDSYEPDDVRLSLIKTSDDGFPYFIKYNGSVGAYTDNVPIFRFPELLLIRAEANAELGSLQDARDDLETLRVARGLAAYGAGSVTPSSKADVIEAVMNERRREFAFEGHRWFDLKRRAMDIPKQAPLPTISYDDYRILAEIPASEIDDSEFVNVEQNPGY